MQRLEEAERLASTNAKRVYAKATRINKCDWNGIRANISPKAPSNALKYGLTGLSSALREATARNWDKTHVRVAARHARPETPIARQYSKDDGRYTKAGVRVSVLRSPSRNYFRLNGAHDVHGYVHDQPDSRRGDDGHSKDGEDGDGDGTLASNDDDDDDVFMTEVRDSGGTTTTTTITAARIEDEIVPTAVWKGVTRVPSSIPVEYVMYQVFQALPHFKCVEKYLRDPCAIALYYDAYWSVLWWYFIRDGDPLVTEHAECHDRVYTRMSENFAMLFLRVPAMHKDVFFANFYDVLAQQVYYSLCCAYTESRDKLSSNFRWRLIQQCATWTLGYMPADMTLRIRNWRATTTTTSGATSTSTGTTGSGGGGGGGGGGGQNNKLIKKKITPIRRNLETLLLQQTPSIASPTTGISHRRTASTIQPYASSASNSGTTTTTTTAVTASSPSSSPSAAAAAAAAAGGGVMSDAVIVSHIQPKKTSLMIAGTNGGNNEAYIMRSSRRFHHSGFMERFMRHHNIATNASHDISVPLSHTVVANDNGYELSRVNMIETRTLNALTQLKAQANRIRAITSSLQDGFVNKRRVLVRGNSMKQLLDSNMRLIALQKRSMGRAGELATNIVTDMKKRGIMGRVIMRDDDDLEQLLVDYDFTNIFESPDAV